MKAALPAVITLLGCVGALLAVGDDEIAPPVTSSQDSPAADAPAVGERDPAGDAIALPRPPAEAGPLKIIELFTSEGCSSCPPADRLMAELATRPGVLVLGFHVDYWDRLGWTDPHSSPRATRRQQRYAAIFGSRRVYTPQAVFGGTREAVASDRAAVDTQLAATPAVRLLSATLDVDGPTRTVRVRDAGGAWLNVAVVRPAAVTDVRRGENAGRTLRHVNVVTAFEVAAVAEDGTAVLTLDGPIDAADAFMVAYTQTDEGQVVAARRF